MEAECWSLDEHQDGVWLYAKAEVRSHPARERFEPDFASDEIGGERLTEAYVLRFDPYMPRKQFERFINDWIAARWREKKSIARGGRSIAWDKRLFALGVYRLLCLAGLNPEKDLGRVTLAVARCIESELRAYDLDRAVNLDVREVRRSVREIQSLLAGV